VAARSAEPAGRALLYERDGLVCERARRMLASEGYACCCVDSTALLHELATSLKFDLFVVGVDAIAELERLELSPDLRPLVIVAPLDRGASAHLAVALPDAVLVDRGLRDPDALRRALSAAAGEQREPAAGLVQRAFEPFGLSQRQLEVLGRALLGETSAEIASHLFISEPTVRNHLHAIYERVEVSGRRELLGRFVRSLLPDDARGAV
jgi:DNA-binding CsgD family transcriptional regulator